MTDVAPTTTAAAPAADTAAAAPSRPGERYIIAGSSFIVVGGLLATMGIALVAVGDDDQEGEQPVEQRSLPIELGVASVGLAGFLAGVYLTAYGRKLNRAAAEGAATAVTPALMRDGVGLAISGSF